MLLQKPGANRGLDRKRKGSLCCSLFNLYMAYREVTVENRGPKHHVNMRILHSGSRAAYKEDSTPYVYAFFCAPIAAIQCYTQTDGRPSVANPTATQPALRGARQMRILVEAATAVLAEHCDRQLINHRICTYIYVYTYTPADKHRSIYVCIYISPQ